MAWPITLCGASDRGLLALAVAALAAVAPGQLARPAPPLTLDALKGSTEAEARARLGPPDVARAEGKGAMWTYRLPDCALLVFFRADEEGRRRLSGATVGPRRRGQPPAPVQSCLDEAAVRPLPGAAPAPAPRTPHPPPKPDDEPF